MQHHLALSVARPSCHWSWGTSVSWHTEMWPHQGGGWSTGWRRSLRIRCQCRVWPLLLQESPQGLLWGHSLTTTRGSDPSHFCFPCRYTTSFRRWWWVGWSWKQTWMRSWLRLKPRTGWRSPRWDTAGILPWLVREDLGRGRNGCCVELDYCGTLGVFSAPSSFFPWLNWHSLVVRRLNRWEWG